MGSLQLTEGSLTTIMEGGHVVCPIMQVLGSKKIASTSSDKDRHRIILSDGKHSITFAMITLKNDEKVSVFSVIKLLRYITSIVNNSNPSKGDARVLLIIDMEVVASGEDIGQKIGNPVPLSSDVGVDSAKKMKNNSDAASASSNGSTVILNGKPKSDTSLNESTLSTQMVHPIASLSPYHNKWVIKARVSNKSQIRTWSNSKGEGKLFSFDLIDESGEIRCTAFRDHVDKYFDLIQVDKVYLITKCQLKPANKQYSNLKNDYEMTITSETVIEECCDDVGSIPQTKYDFVPIDKLAHMEVGTILDVIGVAKSVGDVQTIMAKSTNRELKKRDISLIDKSKSAVTLTLWGVDAENFNGDNNPVIVVKGARVGEFGGGKTLSTVGSTQLKVNPEMEECFALRGWYDREGVSMETTNISATSGSAGSFQTTWLSFREAQERGLGSTGDRGDYYQTAGTVLLLRAENALYKACPAEDCNKKLVDLENGMCRCEKCNREYPNFKWRLLASMNVGDWSGNQWVSMFNSEAEKVLGMTAQQAGEMVQENPDAINQIIDKANFKQFVMKLRCKMETFNDESRMKTVAVKVDPINYEEYNAYLVDSIKQLIG